MMGQYFKDIWSGITTVLAGMHVTIIHFFRPAITVQYPREKMTMYPTTRANLINHEPECGVCLSCQRVCPANCFTIKGIRADKDEDLGTLLSGNAKKMHLIQFDINMSTCLYCGLCVDSCDEKSLRWEQPHTDVVFSRTDLLKDFVTMTEARKKELLDMDAARKAARAAAGGKPGGKPPVKPAPKVQKDTETIGEDKSDTEKSKTDIKENKGSE